MISFRVVPDEAGTRIDVLLATRAGVTRALAQRALTAGAVTVSGSEVRSSYRVAPGDVVEGTLPQPTVAPPRAEDIPIPVRYSDERVLVVSKPPGLVTHPARGHDSGTLVNALLGLGEPLAGARSSRPGIVHRLDKDTSGLLLVAKDDEAQAFLTGQLRARRIGRTYLALVRGEVAMPSGTVDAPVARHPVSRRRMAVVPGGRPAVTHYRRLATGTGMSVLEITLETGRTHQIRVHLSHLGHPVMGDRAYGGASERSRSLGLERPFLHAWKLTFPHPDDGRPIAVVDPLPADLASVLQAAGLPIPS